MKNKFSKHKSRIIYSLNLSGHKILLPALLIVTFLLTWAVYAYTEKNIRPAVTSLAISRANTVAAEIINNAVSKIRADEAEYSKMCEITKNQNGEILSITTNTQKINAVKLKISSALIKLIENTYSEEIKIPIGSVTKSHFVYAKGPKIPIKILITGSPKTQIENKFESAGINQTKHKISVITTVEIEVVLPYESVKTAVSSETMLSETLIVGKIPDVYVSK